MAFQDTSGVVGLYVCTCTFIACECEGLHICEVVCACTQACI